MTAGDRKGDRDIGDDRRGVAYLAMTLGGVQTYIAEARRTSDLWAGSRLISHLGVTAAEAARAVGGRMLMPGAIEAGSFPNHFVLAVPAGSAAAVATAAEAAAATEWQLIAGLVLGEQVAKSRGELADFPDVRWVAWDPPEGGDAGLPAAWRVLGDAGVARRRVRSFPRHPRSPGRICSLCGRFGQSPLPNRVRRRLRRGEGLCARCAVKLDIDTVANAVGSGPMRFPSTATVATEPFRARVRKTAADHPLVAAAADRLVEALRDLNRVMPGDERARHDTPNTFDDVEGSWFYPDTWSPTAIVHEFGPLAGDAEAARLEEALKAPCATGRRAMAELRAAMGQATGGDHRPAIYLAVLAQDGDSIGRALDQGVAQAEDPESWLDTASAGLSRAADAQASLIESELGRPVYAGGDDLLALAPLATVLAIAAGSRHAFGKHVQAVLPSATASTAIVCFHHSFPLQEAVRWAQTVLKTVKQAHPAKDRLTVVVIRRGGERASTDIGWERGPVDALTGLSKAFGDSLSARVIADLLAERDGIAELAKRGLHRTEIERLVGRHGGTTDHLLKLEPSSIDSGAEVRQWVGALEVARFLAAEAR